MINVAVISGGYSDEKIISKKSAETVLENLSSSKYNIYSIIIDKDRWYLDYKNDKFKINKDNFSVKLNNQIIFFDVAFIIIHGPPGEDGVLQSYFDSLNIPYTNSSSTSSSLSFNKAKCNNYLKKKNILCANSILLKKGDHINENEIINIVKLPCFVKPNKNGSSYGVSKVIIKEEIKEKIKKAFKYDNEVLIESFIEGNEVTCGIHNFNENLTTFPCTEIISENEFFDYDAKYNGKSIEITPAKISNEINKKIISITKNIYKILKLNGIARVDYIIKNQKPFLIEVNTIPGLSKESIIPQQAQAAGLSLEKLFDMSIGHAIKNNK